MADKSEYMKGNSNGVKLKDPEIRQLAYKSYCEHLAKGKSKRSWYFEHPDYSCVYLTFEKYLKDTSEFDPIKMEIAQTKGFNRWEQVCEDSAEGHNEKANTASLQMVMRNKFGWDKVKPEASEHKGDVKDLANTLRNEAKSETEKLDNDIQ